MKKTILLAILFGLTLSTYAQAIEGDALIAIIGSKASSPATAQFFSAYGIRSSADGIYSATTTGIDIRTSHDTVVSMTLYHGNPIYGKYANKLPKGITFDMSSADITKLLGKPTTEYVNSGYSEYNFDRKVLTCWFEKGVLRRVTLSLR